MSDEILPCPFCGEKPITMASGENGRGLMIHCMAVDCVNPHVSFYEHDEARRLWNMRGRSTGRVPDKSAAVENQ